MATRRSRPRSGLTREKILDAAIGYVDEHGPAALSTRKLGTVLGVEGMTLYYYVPNKDALLDGMVERILLAATGESDGGADGRAGNGDTRPWPELVRGVATRLRAVLREHPGMLSIVATRPATSPAALRILEDGLSTLRDQGVPLGLAMDVLNAAMTFTIGHTLAEVGLTPGTESDADPGEPGQPAQPGQDEAQSHPHLAEALASGAGLDFESRFTRTLDMIVDGYAALAARRQPGERPAKSSWCAI